VRHNQQYQQAEALSQLGCLLLPNVAMKQALPLNASE